MMFRTAFVFLLVGGVVLLGRMAEAYTIASFSQTVYDADTAAMDVTLGVSGYTVEDFEDGTLVDGLTLSNFGFSAYPTPDGGKAWDGGNINAFYGVTEANPGELNFAAGALSVGIGLSDYEATAQPNAFRINDGPWILITEENFPEWAERIDRGRSMYLRIDMEDGDLPITSLYLTDPSDEWLAMDHVAFSPIPEPSTLALAGLGLLSLAVWGWRRRTS
jgi:hypothetical protein